MARDASKSGLSRIRTGDLRRALEGEGRLRAALIRSPEAAWSTLLWVGFAIACAGLTVWARETPLIAVGQVMDSTATVRVRFDTEDAPATEEARKAERQRTPRVYVADAEALPAIRASLENLPKTLTSATGLDQVDPGIVQQFRLTPDALAAAQAEVVDGEPSPSWRQRVGHLMDALKARPLLDKQTWQKETQSPNKQIELLGGEERGMASGSQIVNVDDPPALAEAVGRLAREEGFSGPLLRAVVSRFTVGPRPTYRYDDAATEARRDAAAARVPVVVRAREPGQVIFARGDVLSQDAYDLTLAERRAFLRETPAWRVWLGRLAVAAASLVVTTGIAGYAAIFCPVIRRGPRRTAALTILLGAALAVACTAAVSDPRLIPLTGVVPVVLVAVLLVIAYDRRISLAFSLLFALLVSVALDRPLGFFGLLVMGVGMAVVALREVRDRSSLVRMSVAVSAALAVGMFAVAMIDRPVTNESLRQTLFDAGLAALGGLLVGGVTLFILPTVERVFRITTSMTLIELRDPKQPLLRQLQQRAPGTYNHSLNVASLAEAGADAIGGNGLLAYIGALYHDIGKINKPDYFVENQTPGYNRHDKLAPAMSLLVIVGHVKDGAALAREFLLPEPLHHFIEAHHGTTLVEYFYHRARKQALSDTAGEDAPHAPQEIEYRYPGPKPRTKEVAIVMLCDAVESAARSMTNPTPGRIEATVRALAQKRLMDGQFDDSDLSLRELNQVVETVAKTLASIYHGRVAYPSGAEAAPEGPRTRTGTGTIVLPTAPTPSKAGAA